MSPTAAFKDLGEYARFGPICTSNLAAEASPKTAAAERMALASIVNDCVTDGVG